MSRWHIKLALMLAVAGSVTLADFQRKASVVASGGDVLSGGSIAGVHVIGQAERGQFLVGTNATFHAGFVNNIDLLPDRDTDGDGVRDEADPDNDNDGLNDEAEASGRAFLYRAQSNPNVVDTDGDGASDLEEALAGTHPADATMFFGFTAIEWDPAQRVWRLSWQACQGRTYEVWGKFSVLSTGVEWHIANVYVATGTGMWLQAVGHYTDSNALPSSLFYQLRGQY